jgi:hypothetical protein
MNPTHIPLVSDFAVVLRDSDDGGMHVEFFSASRGTIARFPEWDHADRDLRHFTPMDVPLGPVEAPYDDRGEAWRIVIVDEGSHVRVAEYDFPRASEPVREFTVPRERYIAAWAALIAQSNPIVSLDDEDDSEVSH